MIPESRQPRLLGRTNSSQRILELQRKATRNTFGRSSGVTFRETSTGTAMEVRRKKAGTSGGNGAVWL